MKIGIAVLVSCLLAGCVHPAQVDSARVPLRQAGPQYQTGQRVVYVGIATPGKLGGYVEDMTARPSVVHLLDGRKFPDDLKGKRVTATGVLLMKMIGSDDGKTQVDRQSIYYMEQYKLDVQE
jgi:hypothetical protein